jgi:CDP-diglyceride synthetase
MDALFIRKYIMNLLLIYIIPILIANLIHHFIIIPYNFFPLLSQPVDFHKTFRKIRILGNTKTFRGFFVIGISTGIFTFLLSMFLNVTTNVNPLLLGTVLGFTYMLGELPNSFIKRRVGVEESTGHLKSIWKYIDHIDSFILPASVLFYFEKLSFGTIGRLVLLGIALHYIINFSLHLFGYKSRK